MAPIFILITENPAFNLSFICCFIKDFSPIQINPLIAIASLDCVNLEGNNSKEVLLCKDNKACSKPNCMEGNAFKSFNKTSLFLLILLHSHCNFSS